MELKGDQSEAGRASDYQKHRPHLAYMSSNQFKITTYDKPEVMNVDAAGSSAPRKKKRKTQKRKAKTLYNPSSRRIRMDEPKAGAETTSPEWNRKLNPAVLIDQVLDKEFSTVSLDCSTLAAQVTAAIQQNEVGDGEDWTSLAKTIVSVIQEMVYIGNEAMRCVQQAVACYLADVIIEHGTLSSRDVAKRKEKFSEFCKFKNNTFFRNLLQDVFCWYDDEDRPKRGRPRKETEANASVKEILGENSAYRRALRKANKTVPNLKRSLTEGLTDVFSQCGDRLADQFQCHFLRNTAELVQRLEVENPAWVAGEGKAIIASINIKKGTSSKHDQLSLFWILNSHLLSSWQMAFLPESGYADNFMHITERQLIYALYANKDCKQAFRATGQYAEDHLSSHPGDLTYRLFFSDRLQYRKNCVLMAPDRDIPAAAHNPLFDLFERELKAYEKLVEDLKGDDHVATRKKFKVLMTNHIEGAQTYKTLLDSGMPTGTIVTNGHELQVLAYGLTKTRPPSTPAPNTTQAKLDDARQVYAPGQPIEDMLPDLDYVIVGIDPGIFSMATATVIDTRTPEQLKNVTVSQGAQMHCTRTYVKGLHNAKRNATFDLQLLDELGESVLDHVHSVLLVQEQLRSFYTSPMFKIKSYHRKTALKATRNKAVDRIISASGLTEKWDESKGLRPVFVVGDGQFGSGKGPILHQQFAQALNMLIVYVDEFQSGRSLKCTGCNYERDRDHNAATNMARAVLMLIEEGVWPDVLCRNYDLEVWGGTHS
ncbi:hypothetical protein EC968_008602 [Mortierella alpina]|nr:hypothetical protein EC968_008602 [Mortierella alpina]